MNKRAYGAFFTVFLLGAGPHWSVPTATPSPTPIKTIVNERTTPFCSSIATHFNAAVVPMLANDRDLDQVNVQLLDINDLFHHPDYQIRYADVRVKLMKYVGTIRESLPAIQLQINLFRQGENLTKDPQVAKSLHQAAEKLQLAYNKQFQLETDLTGVVQTMMSYQPPEDLNIQEAELAEQSQPKDMKDIKSYLRFDGQRDVISQSENAAADQTIDIVQKNCLQQK